jgi:outer membrane translocation and assembly module TamA
LSLRTIRTAVRRLTDHGILRITGPASAKVAQTYEVLWPTEIKRLQRLERSPMVLLKESGAGGEHYEGILEKLTPEDKEILEILASTLPFEEEKRLRKMAREAALKAGEDPGKKFQELIVLTQFGPERLKKYGH